jgi:hypothetical protein
VARLDFNRVAGSRRVRSVNAMSASSSGREARSGALGVARPRSSPTWSSLRVRSRWTTPITEALKLFHDSWRRSAYVTRATSSWRRAAFARSATLPDQVVQLQLLRPTNLADTGRAGDPGSRAPR